MIKNRSQLFEFLMEDNKFYPKVSFGFIKRLKNRLVTTPQSSTYRIWLYVKNLRYAEYHKNNSILVKPKGINSFCHTCCMLFRYWRLRKLSRQTGFQIDPGSFGKGLMIYHYGSIVVNAGAKIGDYATIYPGVLIGAKENGCPVIGNHVMIGAGAKILGGVHIGNHVTIAPNAVVVKDIPDNAIVVGIPARILKFKENEDSSD
mgnify:CR=1 FL=1